MFTEKDRLNADLLAFIRGGQASASPR